MPRNRVHIRSMFAIGPKRTCVAALHESASDPKRTSVASLLLHRDLLCARLMRRRDFIKVIVGSTFAWPLAASAQKAAMPVIGFINSASPEDHAQQLAAFLDGLSETGFVDGRNVSIEYRWAENQNDRLPAMVADLVHRRVAVIVATTTPAALAAKAATTTMPIVFEIGSNP